MVKYDTVLNFSPQGNDLSIQTHDGAQYKANLYRMNASGIYFEFVGDNGVTRMFLPYNSVRHIMQIQQGRVQ